MKVKITYRIVECSSRINHFKKSRSTWRRAGIPRGRYDISHFQMSTMCSGYCVAWGRLTRTVPRGLNRWSKQSPKLISTWRTTLTLSRNAGPSTAMESKTVLSLILVPYLNVILNLSPLSLILICNSQDWRKMRILCLSCQPWAMKLLIIAKIWEKRHTCVSKSESSVKCYLGGKNDDDACYILLKHERVFLLQSLGLCFFKTAKICHCDVYYYLFSVL